MGLAELGRDDRDDSPADLVCDRRNEGQATSGAGLGPVVPLHRDDSAAVLDLDAEVVAPGASPAARAPEIAASRQARSNCGSTPASVAAANNAAGLCAAAPRASAS